MNEAGRVPAVNPAGNIGPPHSSQTARIEVIWYDPTGLGRYHQASVTIPLSHYELIREIAERRMVSTAWVVSKALEHFLRCREL